MRYFIVDAFADRPFQGNPAGVCLLDRPLPPQTMQAIAQEIALPETAFLLPRPQGYALRWFTPASEIDLCGHGTLAATYVVTQYLEPAARQVAFATQSGHLTVEKKGDLYEMTLPLRPPEPLSLTPAMAGALGLTGVSVYAARDLFVVLESEAAVRSYVPDYGKLAQLTDWLGIVLTSPGTQVDFVSRYFCPELQAEDPVTGSSHCALVPLWQARLCKSRLVARQLSPRGGTLYCQALPGAVTVAGRARLYFQGDIFP